MNYLFFDIECANTFDGVGKICEFGYVLVNERLDTVKQGTFFINPSSKFDWYVKHKIIKHPIKKYVQSPLYPKAYKDGIKELLERPDTVYVGHGVRDDVGYINDAAKRYSLPIFDRYTVDSSVIYKNYYSRENKNSLKNIVKELEIGDCKKLHDSEYDAKMTLEYVRVMCKESGLSFSQLIDKYLIKQGKTPKTV